MGFHSDQVRLYVFDDVASSGGDGGFVMFSLLFPCFGEGRLNSFPGKFREVLMILDVLCEEIGLTHNARDEFLIDPILLFPE